MRAVTSARPAIQILDALRSYQDEIDQIPDYPRKVAQAKVCWEARDQNAVFLEVRRLLREMCFNEHCMYCEGSGANQLEHVSPKHFYPEKVFSWENYLFICNPCNIKKLTGFAVFSSLTGGRVDLRRKRGAPVVPPEPGSPLLINPRNEDPLDLLWIDLQNTYRFEPRSAAGTPEWERAEYTAQELLDLNSATHRQARKNAYQILKIALDKYVTARDSGEPTADCIDVMREHPNRGVWAAMKRDRDAIPELRQLFDAAPEALGW